MKKRIFCVLTGALFAAFSGSAQDLNERVYNYPVLHPQQNNRRIAPKPRVEGWASQRAEEKLNRGLTVLRNRDGKMYVNWRLLKSDPEGVAFNVYRSAGGGRFVRINAKPVAATTDFTDTRAAAGRKYLYRVCPIVNGKEGEPSETAEPIPGGLNYTSIKFQGNYPAQKVALADLNGDGVYDYIIKQPNQATDPGVWRRSPETWKIEAYLSDGTFLWRKDLGWNIEQGVWYSPFLACDLNGDGKAEIAVKTAPTDRDYRDREGRVVGTPPFYYGEGQEAGGSAEPCPEYCSILDGMTGEELDRCPWPPQSQRVGDYVRNNRNQIGVAYLDGKTPCLLLNRGTYRAMLLDAYQLKGNKLEKLWSWDGDEENPAIRSQGAHQMVSADVDGDGREEVVLGSVVVDDNGECLWSVGLGHPDKAIVGDIDPSHPGLEILYAIEVWHDKNGVALVDARSGEMLWSIGHHTTHVGDGMAADIDPAYPGLECFAREDRKAGSEDKYMFTAQGERLGSSAEIPGCRDWFWWDADLLRETTASRPGRTGFDLVKYKGDTLTRGIEGRIVLIGDIRGDWREEIVTMLPGELRIYSTDIPAADRRVCLLQDPPYPSYITHRSMGYEQAPMTGFYLGVDPAQAAQHTPLVKKRDMRP